VAQEPGRGSGQAAACSQLPESMDRRVGAWLTVLLSAVFLQGCKRPCWKGWDHMPEMQEGSCTTTTTTMQSSWSVITSKSASGCLGITNNLFRKGTKLEVSPCDAEHPENGQQWLLSNNQVMHQSSDGEFCVDIPNNDRRDGKRLQIDSCTPGKGSQQFLYEGGMIKTPDGTMCINLAADDVDENQQRHGVEISGCNSGDANQQWEKHGDWHGDSLAV